MSAWEFSFGIAESQEIRVLSDHFWPSSRSTRYKRREPVWLATS